jgi:hypothetical protein
MLARADIFSGNMAATKKGLFSLLAVWQGVARMSKYISYQIHADFAVSGQATMMPP